MSDPLFSVQNQVVIVSGASRGIGYAIAEGFVQRDARVIITGRNEDNLQPAADALARFGTVRPFVCDVAKTEDIDKLVRFTLDEFGRIDSLVNVAGVNRRKPTLDITEDDYDFVMDINLKGAFLLSQAVARPMLEQGSGSQINIASLNTDRPLRNVAPYAMSKAAMGQMTKALALEWSEFGVRINAIAPGFILTDLTKKLWSDPTMQQWGQTNTPQRRLGTPADMVGTALFLASPASAFMTGQILYVDGGFTAGWNWPIPAKNQ
ncbi:MAG: SDR family oxidoreductase [Planctomycetales bacterium]|nr:SDR family oxidoreductase [Planctomycetales bacterium]